MASDPSHPGLATLRLSAQLAGISLRVLGLGEPYATYDDKLKKYYMYLGEAFVGDDDIVVLFDSYDVILFPQIRKIHTMFAAGPTPVIACGGRLLLAYTVLLSVVRHLTFSSVENGIYPEPYSPWLYAQGLTFSDRSQRFISDRGQARFLNSGCLAGRAVDMRNMLNQVYVDMHFMKDDQQAIVRYLLSRPHILSVDMPTMRAQGSSAEAVDSDTIWLNAMFERHREEPESFDPDFGELTKQLKRSTGKLVS